MTFENERGNRSSKYQWMFNEISFATDVLEAFTNNDGIHDRLSGGFAYDERILDLEDQLKEEFWRLVEENLTERQKEVLKLIGQGFTQQEVSSQLGVNQSSVVKSIMGNSSYCGPKKTYGGSKKKLQKVWDEDEKVKSIKAKIAELIADKW